jgi:hypothetical protein
VATHELVNSTEPPEAPRYSRKWFGELVCASYGLLVLLGVAFHHLGWHRGGVAYWLVVGPLCGVFVAPVVPWVVLETRDLYRNRRTIWGELSPLAAAVVAVAVLLLAALGLLWVPTGAT